MKIKQTFNIQHSRSNRQRVRNGGPSFEVGRCALKVACSSSSRPPSPVTRQPERGIALIITILMLAVTTFMAVTFLAITQRQRGAVSTGTDTSTAQLAAGDALAAAEAQIMANTLATTNPYNFGLVVSTNYSPPGFGYSLDYLTNNYVDSCVVYMTNYVTREMENRFYLDLNRNAEDDPNGWVPDVDNAGQVIYNGAFPLTNFMVGDPDWVGVLQHPDQPYGPNNPYVARYAFVAVPIGNALDLNAIYNDAMGIKGGQSMAGGDDGFLRNQGVGSWEINLAAFLADLNNNEWLPVDPSSATASGYYQYNEPGGFNNKGIAFEDALSLLSYRYAYNYYSLAPVGGPNGLFTNVVTLPPFQANIDYYSDVQPPMMTPAGIYVGGQNLTLPWSGADNTNHFFDPQELYDTNNPAYGTFAGHLLNAGTNTFGGTTVSTYNRYTYYRLLSQMGVDSVPEQDQINLNYANAAAQFDTNTGVLTNIVFFPNAETNLVPWQPLQFFTIAADKMLRAYSQEWLAENPSNYLATYGMFTNISTAPNPLLDPTNIPIPFGITNIPVVVDDHFVYSSAIQRVLQLAANIYDATTNNLGVNGNSHDYPSVFRPIFNVSYDPNSGYTNIYVSGYEPVEYDGEIGVVDGLTDHQLDLPVNLSTLLNPSYFGPGTWTNVNVYGVPWIIGAKKGFPNFNEFSMMTLVGIERKLEITRPGIDAPYSEYRTNQMYMMSISNSLGVECWNSYASNYVTLNGLTIAAQDILSMGLSNRFVNGTGTMPPFNGNPYPNPYTFGFGRTAIIPAGQPGWPGTLPWTTTRATTAGTRSSPNPNSFDIPLMANVAFLTNSIYVYRDNSFFPAEVDNVNDYVDAGTPPLPQFDLVITNRLRVIMLDGDHIIDYVQFAGPDIVTNLNTIIADASTTNTYAGLWNTNIFSGIVDGTPQGVVNQIEYTMNPTQNGNLLVANDSGVWRAPPGGGTVAQAIAGLNAFFNDVSHSGLGTDLQGNSASVTIRPGASLATNVQVAFTPIRYVYGYTSWQANDPLVHYLASNLNFNGVEPGGLQTGWHQWNNAWGSNAPPTNLGKLNDRYAPWGWRYPVPAGVFADTNVYNLAYKDPLVRSSDNWDFPTYKLPTVGWLGRVHRGTPWQTVYLKASNIWDWAQAGLGGVPPRSGPATWEVWTDDLNPFDAYNSLPVQDWLLFDLFTTAPNANATRGTLSVNVGASHPDDPQAGLAAWSALLSGVQVLSNNVPTSFGFQVIPRYQNPLADELPPSYANLVVNPAGPAGVYSALGALVTNINYTRATFTNADGLAGTFEHVGDVLAAPDLSDQSPFLNWNDGSQQANGISDEMYEWLPQQVMSLLRVSGTPQSPMRYVIYSYGQALKPAANGIYTGGGPLFGMVTNYQVVAESANRAVVNFDSTRRNNISWATNYFGYPVLTNMPSVTNNTAQIMQYNSLPPY